MSDKKEKLNGTVVTETLTYDEEGNLIEKKVETAPRAFSSVEIAVDSKGNVKPAVKVYHEDPVKALKQAKSLMDEAILYANEKSSSTY